MLYVDLSIPGTPQDQMGTPLDQAGTPPGPGTPLWTRQVPPWTRYTPQNQVHPQDQAGTPRTRQVPPWTRYTPQNQVHPPEPGTPPGPGRYPLDQAGTPLPGTRQVHPQDQADTPQTRQVPPWTRYTPQNQVHPQTRQVLPGPGRYTPRNRQIPPRPGRYPLEQCMLGDTGNKRVVRILLECILVKCMQKVMFFDLCINLIECSNIIFFLHHFSHLFCLCNVKSIHSIVIKMIHFSLIHMILLVFDKNVQPQRIFHLNNKKDNNVVVKTEK